MRVGDVVYCKKNIPFTSIKNGFMCIIDEITEHEIVVRYDHRTRCWLKSYNNDFYEYFYDYFYTKKELRKQKLKKINENIH